LLHGPAERAHPAVGARIPVRSNGLIVPADSDYELEWGGERLLICPETRLEGAGWEAAPGDLLVLRIDHGRGRISPRLRLAPGARLSLPGPEAEHARLFDDPRSLRGELRLRYADGAFSLRGPGAGSEAWLRRLSTTTFPWRRRLHALREIVRVYGGPITPLSAGAALDALRRVNAILKEDPLRPLDTRGAPGAVVELPSSVTPILISDLHGRVDNLLRVLSADDYLERVARGDAALILMGDAVHPEDDGSLRDMGSSMLMMDLIFKLKIAFPRRFFFLLGNHDSFDRELRKGGVHQGLVWDRAVTAARGPAYRAALDRFYGASPLIARGPRFICCHAAPPRGRYDRDDLINVRQSPERVRQLTWDRPRSPAWPTGYCRGDVRQLRAAFGADRQTPVLFGHFPRSRDRSVWLNADHIPHHHIFHSAMTQEVSVFAQVEGEMTSRVYSAEPILAWMHHQGWFGPGDQAASST